MKIPELLLPAGNLEKLKVAIHYGADAVYVGGQKFGLRAAADNFTYQQLKEGILFAHEHGSKVYVVLNGFLHDQDLKELPDFISYLESIGTDAVIVSDLGVMQTVMGQSSIPIHLSTQASCLNVESAKFWKNMGAKRIIVGRELSILQAGIIKKEAQIEVEMFIHGSMCMSYSGHCTISNYTQGRDSNRGGCAHSCRFQYVLEFNNDQLPKKESSSFFMSSKDLRGLELLENFIESGIDSLKIEGRMKSPLYVGTTAKSYRNALNLYLNKNQLSRIEIEELTHQLSLELEKMPHREYTQDPFVKAADEDSIYDERESTAGHQFIGQVLEVCEPDFLLLEVKNAFYRGQTLELIPFVGPAVSLNTTSLENFNGEKLEKTKPSTLIKLPYTPEARKGNFVRFIGNS